MKNINRLLALAAALLSAGAMAAVVQPITPTTEDAPMRVSVGLQSRLLEKNQTNDEMAVGPSSVGLGFGFAYNLGYDVEIGAAAGLGWATKNQSRIFSETAKDFSGLAVDVALMTRFMPEIMDGFRLGLQLGLGWDTMFAGEKSAITAGKKSIKFGDVGFRAGLASSYAVTDSFKFSLGVIYAITQMRWYDEGATNKKDALHGIEIPVEFLFALSDNSSFFVDVNTNFSNMKEFGKSWNEEVVLGMNFDM